MADPKTTAIPIERIEMEDWSTGFTEVAEPVWRIVLNGYCADFPSEGAARNFADQIAAVKEVPMPSEPTEICPHCMGSGEGAASQPCWTCIGTGGVSPSTVGWPPNFRCHEDGPGRWVVVNENCDEEYASVVSDPVLARESAWAWWHDVKDQPRGR